MQSNTVMLMINDRNIILYLELELVRTNTLIISVPQQLT